MFRLERRLRQREHQQRLIDVRDRRFEQLTPSFNDIIDHSTILHPIHAAQRDLIADQDAFFNLFQERSRHAQQLRRRVVSRQHLLQSPDILRRSRLARAPFRVFDLPATLRRGRTTDGASIDDDA